MEKKLRELIKQRKELFAAKKQRKRLINKNTREIEAALLQGSDTLPVDLLITADTHLGGAPQLVYDDNGRFAVTSDGYAPLVMDDERIEGSMTAFVEKEMWFSEIRDALKFYLTERLT